MICPNCRQERLGTWICPHCGYEDLLTKKIMYASNRHYNEGLAKARVKDLTGATQSLLTSLKYNKRNTDARNLLGLVYYRTGEIVEALGEWIISMNYQPRDNAASRYIRAIQSNPEGLASANRIIKRYNSALSFLAKGEMDVAIIELKKAIKLNPNYIKAYQLMGLLYIKTKQYGAARRVLVQSLKVDRNNLTSLRYIRELSALTENQAQVPTRTADGLTAINDPNPVVIEKKEKNRYTDFSTGLLSVINVIIGVVIGAAVVWFLVVPSMRRSQADEYNQAVVAYSSQLSDKNKLISSLEKEVEDQKLAAQILSSQLEGQEKQGSSSDTDAWLYKAVREYMNGNLSDAGMSLAEIEADMVTNTDARALYTTIYEETRAKTLNDLIVNGDTAMENEDYVLAVDFFRKAARLDGTNTEVMFLLAVCYQRLADLDNAMIYYQKVVEAAPGSMRAMDAQAAMDAILAATGSSQAQTEEAISGGDGAGTDDSGGGGSTW